MTTLAPTPAGALGAQELSSRPAAEASTSEIEANQARDLMLLDLQTSQSLQVALGQIEADRDSWGSTPNSESSPRSVSGTPASCVDCTWMEEESTSGSEYGSSLPAFRVGEWVFRGGMTVIGNGQGGLKNSLVRYGKASQGHRSKVEKVVVKSVSLDGDEASLDMMKRECEVLKELGDDCHPHVLSMLHCAELPATKELVLLTRHANKGDLAGLHVSGTCMEEVEVRRLSLQVMSALSYLHGRSVIHGDVKPENVFLNCTDSGLLVQLSDFGLATRLPDGCNSVRLGKVQGSHGYIAAEVIDLKDLTCAIDLFSWGVVVFTLLGSYEPFFPASAVKSVLEFDDACWDPVSEKGCAFATRLLAVDPAVRGRAEELLRDPEGWLTCADDELNGAPRESYAPSLNTGVRFHSLDQALDYWQAGRRRCGQKQADEFACC